MTGIILTVFLGWCGGYQFYNGYFGKGILYLFTGGLFGIGWLIDIYSAVKDTQRKTARKVQLKQQFHQTQSRQHNLPTPKYTPIKNEPIKHEHFTYVPSNYRVLMKDGSIEEYPVNSLITDGIHCFSCGGDLYHTSFDCDTLKWEMRKTDKNAPLTALTVKEAKVQGLTYCYNCSYENYLYRHNRLDSDNDIFSEEEKEEDI